MSDENDELKQKVLSGAVLSFFIPIYGYYATYLFEKGFCKQFNISSYLIEITLSEVLKTIGMVIPIIIYIYIAIEIFVSTRTSENPIIRGLGRIIWYIFFVSLIIWGGGWSKAVFFAILILLGIEIFIEFITPLFGGFKGYKKKMKLLQEYEQKVEEKRKDFLDYIFDEIIKQLGGFTFIILFILILSLVVISGVGEAHAKTQKSFMIIKSDPELIVLRKYSENFICTTFDRKKKEIEKEFYIKNIDQITEARFKIVIEDIGPLKPAMEALERKTKKKIK